MIIGCVKEIKTLEARVGVVPGMVRTLVDDGHTVLIETQAGMGVGFTDEDYAAEGATITSADDVWARSDMIIKVKEPMEPEYPKMRENQIIFTYFHMAACPALMEAVIKAKCIAIAYETVQLPTGELPLLTPMSEVAGKMSVQEGAKYLEKPQGGRGVLLGGVAGVEPGKVMVVGGGIVGLNAAKIAVGMGADVTILDNSPSRLRYINDVLPAAKTLYSNKFNILKCLKEADLVVGAVLIAGAKAPKLVTREDLKLMKKGAVIVDVAVDQGGIFETTKATTHDKPVFEVEGVVHYGVANMPGAVPFTSTLALTNATFPYVRTLANKGWKKACFDDACLAKGLNAISGSVVSKPVADSMGYEFVDPKTILAEAGSA